MVALFGEGRHPAADLLQERMSAAGLSPAAILAATRLGAPFRVYSETTEFRRRVASALAAFNTTAGRRAGSPVPAEERARIRSAVAEAMFAEEYGRAPLDDRERAGFLARVSRQATTAVAGYDLTFSPVKSVSALWAIAPVEIAQQIEQAHRLAVADTLTWLEDAAAYTRLGRGGVRQVDVTGLIGAAFEHRDSRAGDPDLHTHLAISNKVQTLDGRWLALDGRPLHQMTVAASERYNTRLEARLVELLGVAFAPRPGTEAGKRPVRELVGMPLDLIRVWSARRQVIEIRRAQLSAAFQAEHGRPPSPVEAIHLAQQATLETRQAKHEPRSLGEQRTAWRAQAVNHLGGPDQVDAVIATVLHRGSGRARQRLRHRIIERLTPPGPAPTNPDQRWIAETAAVVVATVMASSATWREAHVRAEAERQAREQAVPLAVLDRAVEDVVALALSPAHSIGLDRAETLLHDPVPPAVPPSVIAGVTPEPGPFTGHAPAPTTAAGPLTVISEPEPLRRRDGTSVYEAAGTRLFTSSAVLAGEQQLLAIAAHRGGPALSAAQIDVALLESTANGLELNPGQAHLVRELAGSGAWLQLALAPAGTGKTTAMQVLARAWTGAGGTVLGLAPSAVAAAELRTALAGSHTDTLAKLTHTLDHRPTRSRRGARRQATTPSWVRDIGPSTLVIIDEAGMAGTLELARAVQALHEAGASVRLVGDDQQLAAIGAGGVLRDIAAEHGAATLTEVVRFADPAEGAATLALRDGDASAVGYLLDHGRIHVGDDATAAEQAYTAWMHDLRAGRNTILLAPTRELVAQLNERARADRLAADRAGSAGEPTLMVRLSDGAQASTGDTIITLHNSRRLMITSTDWVKNGDRWRVESVHQDGALAVRHLRTGRRIALPGDYVREHVALGYAATIHAAQGLSVDTCHTVSGGADLTRQLLYVALTRGRAGNHLYLSVAGDGNEHTAITRDALLPPTAADIVLRILARDGAQVSATTTARTLADPSTRLLAAASRYHDAVGAGAEDVLGPHAVRALDDLAEAALAGLSSAPAWETLRAHLALLSLDGADPARVLAEAIAVRELDTAEDPAAVLDWRLAPTTQDSAGSGPLPWLPPVPAALRRDGVWGPYLLARARLTEQVSAEVADQVATWAAGTAPGWATPLLDGGHRALVVDLARWRAARGIEDTEFLPAGPRPQTAAEARYHDHLHQRVLRALGDPQAAAQRWRADVAQVAPTVVDDPFWPQLAARLDTAARAGIDVPARLRQVTFGARPLPDEHPASALWWRLSSTLSPAVLPVATPPAARARPAWAHDLQQLLGGQTAERILADPAWTGLESAVAAATLLGWTPAQILGVAHEQLRDVTGDDLPAAGGQPTRTLHAGEFATALTWRVRQLLAAPHSTDAGLIVDPLATEEPPLREEELPPDPLWDEEPPPDLRQDTGGLEHHAEAGNLPASPGQPAASGDPAPLPAHRDLPGGSVAAATAVAAPGVPAERIAELNAAAMQYFAERVPASWVPAYLQSRLGAAIAATMTGHSPAPGPFTAGYAPVGWNSLLTHLRAGGATDEELLAAGLASRASTGRLIDRFRDRLVFPIHDTPRDGQDPRIVGFVGRRNPARDSDPAGKRGDVDRHGPKYLNTAATALFTKGEVLFGLAEANQALASGAVPVLVEGPLDAIAVTAAGRGAYAGVASLGTALTQDQTGLILARTGKPYWLRGSTTAVDADYAMLVATDPDEAGRAAAERAYWLLAGRDRDDVGLATIPHGSDPAQLLSEHGPTALREALHSAIPLAQHIIDTRIGDLSDRLHTVEGRVLALRLAAEVVASRHPYHWQQAADDLAERLDLMPTTVIQELVSAMIARDEQADQTDRATGSPSRPVAAQSPITRSAHPDGKLTPGRPAPPARSRRPQPPILAPAPPPVSPRRR